MEGQKRKRLSRVAWREAREEEKQAKEEEEEEEEEEAEEGEMGGGKGKDKGRCWGSVCVAPHFMVNV